MCTWTIVAYMRSFSVSLVGFRPRTVSILSVHLVESRQCVTAWVVLSRRHRGDDGREYIYHDAANGDQISQPSPQATQSARRTIQWCVRTCYFRDSRCDSQVRCPSRRSNIKHRNDVDDKAPFFVSEEAQQKHERYGRNE